MNERRKLKRRHVTYYVPVYDGTTLVMIGHLMDVSEKGLMVDCKMPLSIGKGYILRLDLTDEAFGRPFLTFGARCRWYRPDNMTPNIFNAGFEIVQITPGDNEIYRKIVEKYGSKDYTFPWSK